MADILTCPTCGGTSKPYDPSRYAALETRINALAGIPDLSAYVARHEAMREALKEALQHIEFVNNQVETMKWPALAMAMGLPEKVRAALADEEE